MLAENRARNQSGYLFELWRTEVFDRIYMYLKNTILYYMTIYMYLINTTIIQKKAEQVNLFSTFFGNFFT